MVKLEHNNKVVLNSMIWAKGSFRIARGLMFSGKEKINRGICLVMPTKKDVRFGASVTMWFCFYDLEILFINSKFEVVDKKILKPWVSNYTPKKPCMYVVESCVGKFSEIKIGDFIKFN